MMVPQAMVEAVGLVFGSLAAAALFCWLSWNAFKLLRHPELGTPLCLVALLVVSSGSLGSSAFLRLSWVYACVAAIVLWPIGRAWRQRLKTPQIERDG